MSKATKVADRSTRMQNGVRPKVSVATITYRHESFIADAIESVLMQEVDFPVEMVIGEDCSPDGTREIILQYLKRYPGLIRLIEQKHNIGAHANFRATVGRCRGEYVALLDGDDYWTAPDKLRKQVALMDAHPEFSVCFHPVTTQHDDGELAPRTIFPPGRRPVYHLADLHHWIGMETASILFRRSALPTFPSWYDETFVGDWALQVLLANRGDIGYIDEVMGIYRLHSGSIFFGQEILGTSQQFMGMIKLQELFCQYLDERQAQSFVRAKYCLRYGLAHMYIEEGERKKAIETIRAIYGECGYEPRLHRTEPMRALLHLCAPPIYRILHRIEGRLRPQSR